MAELPAFKYHPDPLATGSIVPSTTECGSCGRVRGYAYSTSPHVCPWCIADGSACAKLDAEFVDPSPLLAAGVPDSVIEEVSLRTPGYASWQQEDWLVCCDDACEFHGDAPGEELRALDAPGLARLAADSGFRPADLPEILARYEPKGSPAFYKFVCRHCRSVRYGGDCD